MKSADYQHPPQKKSTTYYSKYHIKFFNLSLPGPMDIYLIQYIFWPTIVKKGSEKQNFQHFLYGADFPPLSGSCCLFCFVFPKSQLACLFTADIVKKN